MNRYFTDLAKRLLPSLVCGFLLLIISVNALSKVFEVPCNAFSLLSALQEAETNSEADVVLLTSGCTYNFITFNTSDIDGPNALPILSTEVSIVGNGATLRRDPTAGYFRILKVDVGGKVRLDDLTITNGQTANGQPSIAAGKGGGIYNAGALTLNRSVVSNNRTGNGAVNGSGFFALGGNGAGIYSTGLLNLFDSSVHNNRTGMSNADGVNNAGAGAGVFFNAGLAIIRRSSFYGNTTGGQPSDPEDPAAEGGAIYSGSNVTMLIQNTSIFGNRAWLGAGVHANGDVLINHSTIAYNNPIGVHLGGFNSARLENSIFSNNASSDCFVSSNSIVATNSLFQGTGSDACNIVNGNNSNITAGVADLLSPGNYGGFTPGLALGANSQAINKGSTNPIEFDQRGIRRPQPTNFALQDSDIGAFEQEILTAGVEEGFGFSIFTTTMDQWFEVELDAGDQVTFAASFAHTSGDLDVSLYQKRNLEIPLASATSSSDNEMLEFTAKRSGPYWIRVFGFNGAMNNFDYQISFIRDGGFCVPVKTGSKVVLICV